MSEKTLSQFGIVYGEGETEFAMAMMLTDDISILLMQQGVDVSSVNRLSVPAGFASVGTMTISMPSNNRIRVTKDAGSNAWPMEWFIRIRTSCPLTKV